MFQFVCLEGLVTSMSDLYPSYFFTGHRRKMLLLAISLLCFVVGLFLVTEVSVVLRGESVPALQLNDYGLGVCLCQLNFASCGLQAGLYVFQLFDYYACSGIPLILFSILETLCIGWVYGEQQLRNLHMSR